MKTGKWFAVVLGVLFFGACAGPSKTPPLTGVQEFPADKYLSAKASGRNEAEAQREAVSAMRAIFESKVFAETMARAQFVIGATDPEAVRQRVQSTIRGLSLVELKDIVIGKSWKDEVSGQYHVLAVLDKAQAGRVWEGEAGTITAAMAGVQQMLQEPISDFRRLQALNELMALWLKQEVIHGHLRVIGVGNAPDDPSEFRTAAGTIAELRRTMKVFVAIDGEKSDTVANVIGQHLTENGYTLVLNESEARIMLQGDIHIEDVTLDNPEVRFVRAMVTIQVLDRTTNRQVGVVKEDIRKGHINRSEAVRNAVESLAQVVSDKVRAVFGEAEFYPGK